MAEVTPPEPTGDQCSAKASLGDGFYALWYPQMGGYCGKAVIQVTEDHGPEGCIELWVWHDGEFPFTDGDVDDVTGKPTSPAHIHLCDVEQFRQFAADVEHIVENR